MESSRRYLLQAEIEYWHEMLNLNRGRLTANREQEMRACLREAVYAFNVGVLQHPRARDFRAVA